MKALYIVRKVDELGRVVLPMELRRTLDISENDSLEFFVENDKIIIKKYEPACMFCHNASDLTVFKGRNICKQCAKKIASE
ncbi:MAG: AbrB/MazE/SpoVT family DNA-binding domain-containing protein [Oscillospiraceae bacterium]|jgi:transcriptional pleiotropic regulator of transition state genes|nr:AbrB/MazE/SpoVT family DNA-binding domain-containing protein [Oscillospiraceae bacterium]